MSRRFNRGAFALITVLSLAACQGGASARPRPRRRQKRRPLPTRRPTS